MPKFSRGFYKNCLASLVILFSAERRGTCASSAWTSFPGGRWRPLENPGNGKTGFSLLPSDQTGVGFTNSLSEEHGAANRTLYNGAGVAAGDFDGDGLPDIALAGLESGVELFKNLGNWRFTNVTRQAGISMTKFICRGVALTDINGDGALDLLVSTSGGGVRCWINEGQGRFRDDTQAAGTASPFSAFTMAFADVDGNGTVDLYVANNRVEDIRDRGEVQLRSVGGKPVVPPALTNRFVFLDGQLQEYGEPDVLFLNDGRGHFSKVSWTDGHFFDENGRSLPWLPLDWGLTASFRDLNNDGAPDLYVCNDFWTPDRIWLNDGGGKFRAAPTLAFRQTSGSSMGVDMAYLDGDERPEIFVLDMLSRSPAWRKRQMPAQPNPVHLPGVFNDRPQSLRNTLFRARPDGSYEELANYAGLAGSEWAWQPIFVDVDLDGRPDLLITSGHAHDVQDRDAALKVRARQKNYSAIPNLADRRRTFSADLLENMKIYPPLQTPIVAFHNRGGLRFEDVTDAWGTGQPGIHHGIALADFDGDGDLDFVVNNMNSAAGLYRNDASAPRLAVRLEGLSPNTLAVGAQVVVRTGATNIQRQEVVAGGHYLSSSDSLLMFAARPGAPMTLEICWRSGKTRVIENILGNRCYEISESATDPACVRSNSVPANSWFTDVTDRLGHSHTEDLYDDFQRQPLLPRRLSQLGPGVSWVDLDGDGWEDLVIGTGAGGRLGAYRNDHQGGFSAVTNGAVIVPLPRDTTTILGFPGTGGRDSLLVGEANYEDGFTNAACLLQVEPGAPGPKAVWRDLPSSVGPLALADVDGDGLLELFVGARVQAARWPEATGSVLLRRENGTWKQDEANSKAISSPACVSAAVWTDLNGDGFPELVLAGEFAPLRFFRNSQGRLAAWEPPIRCSGDLASLTNLGQLSGLWTAVTAGDFDGDGKLDLIAGNWGENGEEKASPERPLTLFAAEAGTPALALVETTYEANGELTPSRTLEALGAALPFLVGRFGSYQEYSEASLARVLGNELSRFRRFEAATLKTLILLNRGDFFEVRELPREAQLAPVFGICVADFDLDGAEDLFLAQNFFATRPGVPRLDGGRGLLLKGSERGKFEPLDGGQSGLEIYGEQRGAAVADFDHDGRVDLVVTQNGTVTRLFKNTCRRRGIRVSLVGPPGNPQAIGAVAVTGRPGVGARELHAGSGYWSEDGRALELPVVNSDATVDLKVRWPGGSERSYKIAAPKDEKQTVVIEYDKAR